MYISNILIFSDSHGRGNRMAEVIDCQPKTPDAILFLGDGLREWLSLDKGRSDAYEVAGNCDFMMFSPEGQIPYERVVDLCGVRVCMMHGHKFGVKSSYEAAAAFALSRGADVLLYGHTHQPADFVIPAGTLLSGVRTEKPLHVFNPGSIGEAPSGGGSFGVLTVRDGVCLFSHGEY